MARKSAFSTTCSQCQKTFSAPTESRAAMALSAHNRWVHSGKPPKMTRRGRRRTRTAYLRPARDAVQANGTTRISVESGGKSLAVTVHGVTVPKLAPVVYSVLEEISGR